MAILSLLVLIGAIAFGFIKKINVGIIAIPCAFVVGKLAGMSDKEIIAGFGVNLFIILLGATFLFAILQKNGTLELLAQKIVAAIGRKAWMMPIAMFVLGAVISGIGPGVIPSFALVAMFGVPLAKAMNTDVKGMLTLISIGQLGSISTSIVPIAPSGIVAITQAENIGVTNLAKPMMLSTFVYSVVIAAILFLVLKGWKIKGENIYKLKDLPKFSTQQSLSLLGVAAMVITVVITGWNIGLVAFAVAVILLIFKAGDDKECIKAVPWGTLIMVSGVGILMNVVVACGGIELMTTALSSIMTPWTAPAIFTLICGCMSWFSSTSGVVMPTMIPAIPGILAGIGADIPPALMICALVIGASPAGLSPGSSGGAAVMAALGDSGYSTEEVNKIFIQVFLISIFCVLVSTVLTLLGVLNIFSY